MASIAASPVYPTDGLKKRSRLSDSYDLSRKKRCRDGAGEDATAAGGDADVAKFTQRHVDYFEQVKQAEIARISLTVICVWVRRAEYEQFIMKKDAEFQRGRQELMQTHERLHHQSKDVERLQGENKLLKRAIAIQSQQKDEVQQENAALRNLTTQAAEHIKRLEQANYTLRVHLQTSTNSGHGHRQQPPDVY
ncbi:hypothetical protein BBJ28_00002342 [Nothophytophthora sp. Chile5]|nr:hypothetical protein BBJ28_00002342 [Nothophytophthora sp. Chile5]